MNTYIPKVAKIIDLIKHTEKEWTFRVECDAKNVLPGKFFEISMPKYGDLISASIHVISPYNLLSI